MWAQPEMYLCNPEPQVLADKILSESNTASTKTKSI